MTADTSPCCIAAFSASSEPSWSVSSETLAKAWRRPAEAAVPSWSTKPTEIFASPLPPEDPAEEEDEHDREEDGPEEGRPVAHETLDVGDREAEQG
jgi:hypothetical protein